jgi:predicted DCC family thiol-disulfide oxidoreductase YuxK
MNNHAKRSACVEPVTADTGELTVLYDGACPLCRREIEIYRGLAPIEPVVFADISVASAALPAGTTREQLLARFHVRHADGRFESGARAFLALWKSLPGWRWLAKLRSIPGMTTLLEGAYRLFLTIRPGLQRLARRFDRRRLSAFAVVTTSVALAFGSIQLSQPKPVFTIEAARLGPEHIATLRREHPR